MKDRTITAIKRLILTDYPIRFMITKDRYDRELCMAMRGWCRERFGPSATGEAVNRDEPGFYKEPRNFIDPDVARFIYDPTRFWATRYTFFHFRNPDHAFEFKLRWM